MQGPPDRGVGGRWTRARLLRSALGGGAVIAGGVALVGRDGGMSLAAPSRDSDIS
jgi:hypothetical protein